MSVKDINMKVVLKIIGVRIDRLNSAARFNEADIIAVTAEGFNVFINITNVGIIPLADLNGAELWVVKYWLESKKQKEEEDET